jgi:hypothetical protein
LSDQHRENYRKTALSEDDYQYFNQVAADSRHAFGQIPEHNDDEFKHYLAEQQQTYQRPS